MGACACGANGCATQRGGVSSWVACMPASWTRHFGLVLNVDGGSGAEGGRECGWLRMMQRREGSSAEWEGAITTDTVALWFGRVVPAAPLPSPLALPPIHSPHEMPLPPPDECISLLKELDAPVEYIVLPTFAYEHKVFVGPFSRRFPKAKVWGRWRGQGCKRRQVVCGAV